MKKDHNNFYILKTIASDSSVSQRKLSSQMELNVASVNFALKNLVKKGFVTMEGENSRRTKYYVTPKGLREKTHLAYKFFGRNIHFYKEIRRDIEAKIAKATNGIETGLAIYGANELSEITYMVVSKTSHPFQGFFLERSRITNEKILGFNVQDIKLLKSDHQCLLLLTEEFSVGELNNMDAQNVRTLNLADYISVV